MGFCEEKLESLLSLMKKYAEEDIIVAFSGGVDSSIILKAACMAASQSGKKVYAVTMHTTLHPSADIEISKKVADELGAEHTMIYADEIENAGIKNNPVDRCYLCKKYLFNEIKKKAEELGVRYILEGTNEDDLHVYRPGIKAVKELGIMSPLAECKITKKEVRFFAEKYGISVSDRPSAPCLATRFPYNTPISYENMKKVEKGEEFIKTFGVYNIRLRIHNNIARIEIDEKYMMKIIEHKKEIIEYLKNLGYDYVTMDLEGFRSGSMDIFLSKAQGGK